MACKWIIGAGAFLDVAHDAWQHACPELQVEKITLGQNTTYEFDLSVLDTLHPDAGTAFVAFDERFGNFKRMELMAAVLERGFKLEPFISPRAMLAGNVQIGANAFVGDGAIVGHGSRIDYNSVLLPGVQVGNSVHIRSSCWLESGVIVGDGAQIGAHCTLRMGALVAPKVKIGRNCELGWAQRYEKDIAAKTTFDARYDAPIYTYSI
jgi:acetyltransferase-like isoleucine patch superfamily enzyme